MSGDGRWLNLDEAAAHLGMSRRWLQEQVTERKLPHRRMGAGPKARVRFTPADLRAIEAVYAEPTIYDLARRKPTPIRGRP